MEKKLKATRTIAGILAVLLIIAIAIIVKDTLTIGDLKNPNKNNITVQADTIRDDCTATDADSKSRCADDLQKLSDLLAQFSKQQGVQTAVPNIQGNVKVQTAPVTPTTK